MENVSPTSKWKLYSDYTLLAVIIITAGFLRFSGLTSKSYREDEVITLQRVSCASSHEMQQRLGLTGKKQIAYYHLIHAYTAVFAQNLHSIRILSAMAGVLTVLFMFLMGRELFGMGGGLIAASLTAIAEPLLYYSQYARCYSLLAMTSVLTIYFFVRLFRSPVSSISFVLNSVLYMFFSLASMYLHYFGILFICCQLLFGGWLVLKQKTPWRVFFLFPLFMLLGYTPLLPTLFAHARATPEEIGISWIPGTLRLVDILIPFNFMPSGRSGGIIFIILFISFTIKLVRNLPDVLVCLGMIRSSGKIRAFPFAGIPFTKGSNLWINKLWNVGRPEILLLILAIVPVMVAFGVTECITPVWVQRYLIVCLPPTLLLLSHLFIWIIDRTNLVRFLAFAILVAGSLNLIFIENYYSYSKNPQYSYCLDWLAHKTTPDVPIYCHDKKCIARLSAWYLKNVHGISRSVYFKGNHSSDWQCLSEQGVHNPEKIFILCQYSQCTENLQSLIKPFGEGYEREKTKHFIGYHVHIVRKIIEQSAQQ